jgi:hypothetical protein
MSGMAFLLPNNGVLTCTVISTNEFTYAVRSYRLGHCLGGQ